MKLFNSLVASVIGFTLTGCGGEYNSPSYMSVLRDNFAGNSYQYTTSDIQARAGETSERFELRHGDCGPDDCNRDRQRIEIVQDDFSPSVGEKHWYGWSIYLPEDFQTIDRTTLVVLGQAKISRWRSPLWDFSAEKGLLKFKHSPKGSYDPIDCKAAKIKDLRGKWTDIVVFADYGLEKSGMPMLQTWINGDLICKSYEPLVTKKMLEVTNRNSVHFNYGVYASYLSRWLNDNKTKNVEVKTWTDVDEDGGGSTDSITNRPFDFDWGIELPTLVVYYDEVRLGSNRSEVDIRLN